MTKEKIKKIFISAFAIYCALAVSFYFLAGDQLRYRDSRRNIEMLEASTSTGEITRGVVVEQPFINYIDRLQKITFKCTTFYRENSGRLDVGVYHNGDLLFSGFYNVSKINEGDVLVLESNEPIEDLTGQELVIKFSSNSLVGSGVAILQNISLDGSTIKIGDKYRDGTLCFGAYGEEFIFTGQYYWYITGAIGIAFGLLLTISYLQYVKSKTNYIVVVLCAIDRYQFLISQLVSRDFKTKYKRSILGVFWSFLNPLLTMTVQYFVFSTFFSSDIKNYPVYLLIGVICYSFFNESTTMCLTSISHNDRLITKVYVPKYIFPISRTLSSSVNLLISLIPLLLVSLITGLVFGKSAILALFFLVCLIMFSLGIGMFLATLMVFFRDIQFLWSVICMIWMYATPIFYPASIIPPKYSFIQTFNPLYQCIKNIRVCLINGISPEPKAYAFCFVLTLGTLLVGSFIFKKNQDKFTLYL